MRVLREGESLKQCKDRLCRARAQAIRSGQPHHKLDQKIAYINSLLSARDTPTCNGRPSPSKYASHTTRFYRPVSGGKVSPK